MDNKKNIYPGPEKTGLFIRELRLSHNLTQEDLGNEVFVTRKAVSKWENGICYPSIDLIPKLADLFGVTLEELLSGEFKVDDSENPENSIDFIIKIFRNKQVKAIITFIIIFLTFCLLIFFFENYNATKLYNVYYEDDNVYIYNGLIITTRAKSYYSFGNCFLDFPDIDRNKGTTFTIYLMKNNKKTNIITFKSNYEYNHYFENGDFKELTNVDIIKNKNNLYLNIEYIKNNGDSGNKDIHLKTELKYRSNDIITVKKNNEIKQLGPVIYNELLLLNNKSTTEERNNITIDLNFLKNYDYSKIYDRFNNKKIFYRGKEYLIQINYKTIYIVNLEERIIINNQLKQIKYFSTNLPKAVNLDIDFKNLIVNNKYSQRISQIIKQLNYL